MLKQFFINRYFHKLCKEKFLKNDEETIIGKAKDVIQYMNEQINYVNNPENKIDEEDIEFIVTETGLLIEEINKIYFFKNNVIGLSSHPMSGFYVLQDRKKLLEDLKEYYEEKESK